MGGKKPVTLGMPELVSSIAKGRDIPKEYVSATISSMKEIIRSTVLEGGTVDLGRDFGRFTTIMTKSRVRHNPHTGGVVKDKSKQRVRFRPAASFKVVSTLAKKK